MKRKLLIAVSLLCILSTFSFVTHVNAAPGISLSPSSGPPDTHVSLTGGGFPNGGIPCNISWDGGLLGSTNLDAAGNISFDFAVPSDATLGGHNVTVLCADQQSAGAGFNVVAGPPTATLTCQQKQNCTPTPPPQPTATKTCQQLQNCTPTPTKTCAELQNCTPTPSPTTNAASLTLTQGESATFTETATETETPLPGAVDIPGSKPGPFSNPGILIGGGILGLVLLAGLILGMRGLGGRGSEDMGPKHDDPLGTGDDGGFGRPGGECDPAAFGPKHEDPGLVTDDPAAFGPKHEDPGLVTDDPAAFGPKHEDPGLVTDDPAAFGPKHEDPGLSSDESGDDLPGPGSYSTSGSTGKGTPGGGDIGPSDGFTRPGGEGDPHATVGGPGSGGGGDVSGGS